MPIFRRLMFWRTKPQIPHATGAVKNQKIVPKTPGMKRTQQEATGLAGATPEEHAALKAIAAQKKTTQPKENPPIFDRNTPEGKAFWGMGAKMKSFVNACPRAGPIGTDPNTVFERMMTNVIDAKSAVWLDAREKILDSYARINAQQKPASEKTVMLRQAAEMLFGRMLEKLGQKVFLNEPPKTKEKKTNGTGAQETGASQKKAPAPQARAKNVRKIFDFSQAHRSDLLKTPVQSTSFAAQCREIKQDPQRVFERLLVLLETSPAANWVEARREFIGVEQKISESRRASLGKKLAFERRSLERIFARMIAEIRKKNKK